MMRVRAANTHRGCYPGTVFVCLNRAYRTWAHLSLNVSLKQSESYSISARSCIFFARLSRTGNENLCIENEYRRESLDYSYLGNDLQKPGTE